MLAGVRLRSWARVSALFGCALWLAACLPVGTPPLLAPAATRQSAGGPTGSASAPQGWLTYRDPELGYAFSYPAGAYLEAGTDRHGVHSVRIQFDLPAAGYQGMLLRIEPNPQHEGVERTLARLYDAATGGAPQADLLVQLEAIRIGGLPGVRTTASEGDFAIAIPYGDYTYVAAPVHGAAAAAVTPEALALYYQVLDTLVFSGVTQ